MAILKTNPLTLPPQTAQGTTPLPPADLILSQDINTYGDRLVTAGADHRVKVWAVQRSVGGIPDQDSDGWELLDSWRPHSGEILCVRFLTSPHGTFLGTLATDSVFKLWTEGGAQSHSHYPSPKSAKAPSGRRFKNVLTLHTRSPRGLPWCDMAFKCVGMDVFLALVTVDGLLCVFEPVEQGVLGGEWDSWMGEATANEGRRSADARSAASGGERVEVKSIADIKRASSSNLKARSASPSASGSAVPSIFEGRDSGGSPERENAGRKERDESTAAGLWLTPTRPPLDVETPFTLSFHPDPLPVYTALSAGFNERSISLAVGCGELIKVFRSDVAAKKLVLCAVLGGAQDVVRDIAWAGGSVRGWDVIASGSKDGYVRIYELRCVAADEAQEDNAKKQEQEQDQTGKKGDGMAGGTGTSTGTGTDTGTIGRTKKPSGIGARLAALSVSGTASLPASPSPAHPKGVEGTEGTETTRTGGTALATELTFGSLRHKTSKVAEIDIGCAVWRISFSPDGSILSCIGDEQVMRSFRRSGSDGVWRGHSEVDVRRARK